MFDGRTSRISVLIETLIVEMIWKLHTTHLTRISSHKTPSDHYETFMNMLAFKATIY
jgi:hypothetical protein